MATLAFVSMPFGDEPEFPDNEWTKLYDYGLKPLETDLPRLPEGIRHVPVKLWRADRNLESLTLKTNVIRGIESRFSRHWFCDCRFSTGHSVRINYLPTVPGRSGGRTCMAVQHDHAALDSDYSSRSYAGIRLFWEPSADDPCFTVVFWMTLAASPRTVISGFT